IVTQYYASILNEAVEVTKGYGYRLFMSKNCETAWVDKANGKYKNAFTATLTAVTATSGAKLVYTLDGSTPTASSTQVESGATINITQPCTLKVGLLKGSAVSGIVTRTYEFSAASRFINVYVNVENVGWDPVRYYTWDQVDAQHNGNWPGEAITTTTQIAGHTWYVKQYELEDDDCYINFVFNTGANGSPQTIDVLEATTDMYYVVKNTKQGDKYVVEAIDDPANFTLDTVPGDVNGDGEVTGSDVTALYNHILFGQDTAIFNGDQNGDGEVTGSDVTAVYNIILGL
ncbi:MAG: chitobiase/beta-hexosaminidase C-terminal domain-containing protein, partial [Muribaculaceae bacterium]|nr:chitobiase/beta-hexosaminidase C-terminal domain-containing protein [Muribaculaceae bacterium]